MSEEQRKVWLVTEGEYSAYSVVAVFDDKDMMEEFRQRFGHTDNEPEEFTLNPAIPEVRAGLNPYAVFIARDGQVLKVATTEGWLNGTTAMVWGWDASSQRWYPASGWSTTLYGSLRVCCYAKDEQHAIKIANERRIQMLALNQWPELPAQE